MKTVNYSQPNKSLFASGGLAELVDAYALGAYDFGHVSSSLMSPTSKKTSEVTNTGLQICCTSCCIREKMLHNEEGKVNRGVVLEDMVVLGFIPQPYIHSLVHIILQYQQLFFKISIYALVNSFCNKCNKTIHLLNFLCNTKHKCIQ
jgi:hypothetical protein